MEKKLIDKLSEFISNNDLTYEKVAKDLNVSKTTVSRWINCERGIGPRSRHKIKEYLKENRQQKTECEAIKLDNWPLTSIQLQQLVDYFSAPLNRAELFEVLAKIERNSLDHHN
ncbi:MAG: LacI family DNA-binding transcriptional regulator [Lentisphaerae bacterium]|nr:LacI family DNA-binding transcriptional regulator [Lentisphaerota bacterium]